MRKKRTSRFLALFLSVFFMLGIISMPQKTFAADKKYSDEELLDLESRKSFDFFWKETNTDKSSDGFGLIKDRAPGGPDMCSVASVGFGLTAYVIGAERGWISQDEAKDRINGTLDTLLNKAENVHGFFYHFLDMNTAKRYKNTEVSVIDTAIAVNGAITAGEYFGGEIKEKAEKLYKKVEWDWYRDPERNQFYMGYSPEKGFEGWWDFYAEQLMLYVLGAASPTHAVDSNMFYSFIRNKASYGNYEPFIHSWFGSIFTYQFSHAWIDFANKVDKQGVNWWTNSVIASKSDRQFCIDMSKKFKAFGENSWGLTACDGPNGYSGKYGTPPSGFNNDMHFTDGTVPPAGALGSIPFTPEESLGALRNYYENYPKLVGEYGLKDSYNLDKNWYGEDVIGIDKGITLLMIENYRSNLVWKYFMKNKYVQSGMKKIGLTDIGTMVFDDFEGNTMNKGWKDNGDKVYNIETSSEQAYTGNNSLKISLDKNGNEWAFVCAEPKDNNFSQAQMFTSRIYNASEKPLKLILKFETEKKAHEIPVEINSKDKWEKIEWDLTKFKDDMANLKKVLIFAAPGEANYKGTFYLDDLNFITGKLYASNVMIEGSPVVNETLKGSYSYYNADNIPEGESSYQWLRSKKLDGDFEPIEGANSINYKVKNEDVGYYLKLQVIPKSIKDSDGKIQEGPAAISLATPVIEVNYPVVSKVTITKPAVYVDTILDDFDSNKIGSEWKDSGDKVYTLVSTKENALSQGNSLKIDYNKTAEWAFFYKAFDKSMDFSKMNTLKLNTYNNPKMIIKFENSKGQGLIEKWFEPSENKDSWKELTWDLTPSKDKLKDVKRILVFVEPGVKDVKSHFYMDNFKLVETSIEDVTLDGKLKVGDKLIGSYNYHHAKGLAEEGTSYRWLISSEKDGQYTEIKGATESSYTVRPEDAGKYIKFQVTPRTNADPKEGKIQLSNPTNKVEEDKSSQGNKDNNEEKPSKEDNSPKDRPTENKPVENKTAENKSSGNSNNEKLSKEIIQTAKLPSTGSVIDFYALILIGSIAVAAGIKKIAK